MSKKIDVPIDGEKYLLIGGTGDKCISNGNTWSESIINKDQQNKPKIFATVNYKKQS
tara:strand:- start:246 stop:416 length:171 start_codon:yes stop_codon:yes gene_type:complete